METCYRHSSRETGVACSNCGRPICTDCMTTTPVGMRCPECSKQKTPVRTMRNIKTAGNEVTQALIAINVVVFLASGNYSFTSSGAGGSLVAHGQLSALSLSVDHEYWRLLTSGFLHQNVLHIGFNMYLLYVLGQLLEPAIGRVKFLAIYFVALFTGACGSLIGVPDYAATIGASGAVFGLMGAAVVEMRARGIDPMSSGIPMLILLNLVLSATFAGKISLGGHVGGLIGGILAAFVINQAERRRQQLLGLLGCLVLALGSIGAAVAIANDKTPPIQQSPFSSPS